MLQAIDLAREAESIGEVPIGCLIIHDPTCYGELSVRGFNRRETDRDPTAHAEILAMREAGKTLGHWRLLDCTLYVTLESMPDVCRGDRQCSNPTASVYGCGCAIPRPVARADVLPALRRFAAESSG